tara:strand:- start:218 stop:730 length:513 start_codon:yes stop_codon:yes gene_type:complete
MMTIKIFGEFPYNCTSVSAKFIKKDWKTLNNKCDKFITSSLLVENVFAIEFSSLYNAKKFSEKLQNLSSLGKITCSCEFFEHSNPLDTLDKIVTEHIEFRDGRIEEEILQSDPIAVDWDKYTPPTQEEYKEMFDTLGYPDRYFSVFKELFDENQRFWWESDDEDYISDIN